MSDFEKGMKIRGELEAANQAHLLQFYDALDQDRKEELEADLKSLEIDKLGDMFKGFIFCSGVRLPTIWKTNLPFYHFPPRKKPD